MLRAPELPSLEPVLESLQAIGCRHVELAWNDHPAWARHCARLIQRFPSLRLGAASVCEPRALAAAVEAGCRYVVSPVLEDALVRQAEQAGVALVPGVFTPTEVRRAMGLGCPLVKLFPAAALGAGYWRSLRGPLSPTPQHPWPLCIAAGGLGPADVLPWLAAGVNAVALGSSLLAGGGGQLQLEPLERLLASLPRPELTRGCTAPADAADGR